MKNVILSCILALAAVPAETLPNNRDIDCDPSWTRLQCEDGSYYLGQVKNGVRHGQGRFVASDGAEYKGEYAGGMPHGSGTFYYPDGRIKKVRYESGRLMEAHLLAHETDDQGCRFGEFVSLGNYRGWFKGDRVRGYVPHGRGVMSYFNGSVFSGQWDEGKMHGNGSVRWEDGSQYSGQWVHGKRTGHGTYTWANGDTYVGEWKENEICGSGTMYYSNGKVTRGTWKEKTVNAGGSTSFDKNNEKFN